MRVACRFFHQDAARTERLALTFATWQRSGDVLFVLRLHDLAGEWHIELVLLYIRRTLCALDSTTGCAFHTANRTCLRHQVGEDLATGSAAWAAKISDWRVPFGRERSSEWNGDGDGEDLAAGSAAWTPERDLVTVSAIGTAGRSGDKLRSWDGAKYRVAVVLGQRGDQAAGAQHKDG